MASYYAIRLYNSQGVGVQGAANYISSSDVTGTWTDESHGNYLLEKSTNGPLDIVVTVAVPGYAVQSISVRRRTNMPNWDTVDVTNLGDEQQPAYIESLVIYVNGTSTTSTSVAINGTKTLSVDAIWSDGAVDEDVNATWTGMSNKVTVT